MKNSDYIELLKLYWEEWKFRQEGLWKRTIQFFVINFFVSTLPITINMFSVSLPKISMLVFPIIGMMLIGFFLCFCLSESIRIASIDNKVKKIICDIFSEEYAKTKLVSLSQRGHNVSPFFYWRMAVWVPISLSIMQTIVAISMVYLVVTNKLS